MHRYFSAVFALIITLICLAGCQKEPPRIAMPDETEESVDTIPQPSLPETEDVPNTPPEPSLPLIHEAKVSVLPHGIEAAQMHARFSGSKAYYFFYESGKENMEFYRVQNLYSRDEYIEKLTLTLRNGYTNGKIIKAYTTSGQLESDGFILIVDAERDGEQVYLNYTFSANKESGLYDLTSVTETTEEEFASVLGDRTPEFVPITLELDAGNLSLSLPSYWDIIRVHSKGGSVSEKDVIDHLPIYDEIKRVMLNAVETDFDTLIEELAYYDEKIIGDIISGTTIAEYEYNGVCCDLGIAYRYIFRITTEREIYNFEVWEWPAYDESLNFYEDVMIPVVESFSIEYAE